MSDINYEAHPEYASYGNWEDLAAAQKKEIERLRGHINWLNDANDGGRLAINEIERLRVELAQWKRAADEGHPQPCTLGPECPYCEIERMRKELAEKDDYIRTVSRPIGAHSYE